MEVDQAMDIVRESLKVMLVLSGPILGGALVIGLTISLFQAVTQIQEPTLSFVPKIIGMGIITILIAPWGANILIEYAARMFSGAG